MIAVAVYLESMSWVSISCEVLWARALNVAVLFGVSSTMLVHEEVCAPHTPTGNRLTKGMKDYS
eukprot:1411592-Amphidinium_carterae.1